jgi:hypothetical protein
VSSALHAQAAGALGRGGDGDGRSMDRSFDAPLRKALLRAANVARNVLDRRLVLDRQLVRLALDARLRGGQRAAAAGRG